MAAVRSGGGTSTSNAVTGATAQPGTSPQVQTAYLTTCTRATVTTPSRITMTCADSNYSLVGLQWQNWGAARAVATGNASMSNCARDCPAGQAPDYRVQVTAPDPVAGPSGPEYARLSITYLHAPPRGVSNPDVWSIGPRGPRTGSASAHGSAQHATAAAHPTVVARPCSRYYRQAGWDGQDRIWRTGARGWPLPQDVAGPERHQLHECSTDTRGSRSGQGHPCPWAIRPQPVHRRRWLEVRDAYGNDALRKGQSLVSRRNGVLKNVLPAHSDPWHMPQTPLAQRPPAR